jgi:hypothetical protein
VWNCTTVCKRGRANCPNCKPVEEDYIKQSVVGMIKDLIDSKQEMFYLSNEQLNKLLQKSDKEQDKLEEQILKCHRQLELKSKKKSKLLSLYVDEKITEEEFDLQRQTVEKEIQSIQELLNDLEEEIDYKDIKKNTSRQISKLISEGKAEGFNKELFDLLVNRIVVGGKRWSDGVDDPKSLHFELKDYNLSTDMTVVMDESGTPRYTMDSDMEETESENSSKKKQ